MAVLDDEERGSLVPFGAAVAVFALVLTGSPKSSAWAARRSVKTTRYSARTTLTTSATRALPNKAQKRTCLVHNRNR